MYARFSPLTVIILVFVAALVASAGTTLRHAKTANALAVERAMETAKALAHLADIASAEYARAIAPAMRAGLLPAAQGTDAELAGVHLPLAFSQRVAEALDLEEPGLAMRVYNSAAGMPLVPDHLDRFARDALTAFSKQPGTEYWRTENAGENRLRLRYSEPVALEGECRSCHGTTAADKLHEIAVREVTFTLNRNEIVSALGLPVTIGLLLSAILAGSFVVLLSTRRVERRKSASTGKAWQLKKEMAEPRSRALTDALSRLANRRAFDELMASQGQAHAISTRQLGLILLDIDHFGSINDTYGRAAGDAVITQLGMILADDIRASDFAARIGGQRFAIVLPSAVLTDLVDMAQRLRKVVARSDISVWDTDIRVTVSIGVAILGIDEVPDDCLNRALALTCRAKAEGRNRVIAQQRGDLLSDQLQSTATDK